MPDATPTTAGWYPDPADPVGQRWWSGTEWTDHVATPDNVAAGSDERLPVRVEVMAATTPDQGAPASSATPARYNGPDPYAGRTTHPPLAQAAVEPATQAAQSAQSAQFSGFGEPTLSAPPPGYSTASSPYPAYNIPPYGAQPAWNESAVSPAAILDPAGPVTNFYIWAMVAGSTPGWTALGIAGLFQNNSGVGASLMVISMLLALGAYIAGVIFANLDQAWLRNRGFTRTFHWAFAFIPMPVYILGRSIVVTGQVNRGMMPFWVWLIALLVGPILFFTLWVIGMK